jgi:alpha/beta superfamily hydrolase
MKIRAAAAAFALAACAAQAADKASLVDTLVKVSLDRGAEQAGVLTVLRGDQPRTLVLLMPGDPAVLRPVLENGEVSITRLRGNTLVRARHLLIRPGIATLLVDCRSDSGDSCRESYALSKERVDDVAKLLARAKQDVPTATKVWVVGHSFGGHSSAAFARWGEGMIDGAIYASAIFARNRAYPMLVGWDLSQAKVPQLIVAHRDDPCQGTAFSAAEQAARRYHIPLVAVTEAGSPKGDPCGAFSQHGFVGAERTFMDIIADAAQNGVEKFRH